MTDYSKVPTLRLADETIERASVVHEVTSRLWLSAASAWVAFVVAAVVMLVIVVTTSSFSIWPTIIGAPICLFGMWRFGLKAWISELRNCNKYTAEMTARRKELERRT